MPADVARRVAILLLGLAAGLAGCGGDSGTSTPPTSGLTVVAQQLIVDGGGCRLRATLDNRTGSDVAGIMVFSLLDATGTSIGSAAVFPAVPNGQTRQATSDLLVATAGSRQLACSEIANVRVDPTRSNVPIA